MSRNGDYPDDMAFRDQDERELERLLGGESLDGDGTERELAEVLTTVRSAYSQPPDQATQRVHLAAIVAAAGELDKAAEGPRPFSAAPGNGPQAPSRAPHRRMGPVAALLGRSRLAAGAAAVLAGALMATAGTAGLAVAGVDLPDAASEAFEGVGVYLPNQTPDDVREVIQKRSPTDGCEFGWAVAGAARGERSEEGTNEKGRCVSRPDGEASAQDQAPNDSGRRNHRAVEPPARVASPPDRGAPSEPARRGREATRAAPARGGPSSRPGDGDAKAPAVRRRSGGDPRPAPPPAAARPAPENRPAGPPDGGTGGPLERGTSRMDFAPESGEDPAGAGGAP